MSRFLQILKDGGIESPNYKSSYLQNRLKKRFGDKICIWRSNKNSSYIIYCDSVPKGQVIEAAIASSSSENPYTITDPVQDSYIDDIAVHIYYAAKAIRGSLLEVSSTLKWPPTGDCISEDNITIPDMLYNWFAWVLTEDSSTPTISLKRESTSEMIHRRITSFAQDLIYSVSRGRIKTPKHVGLSVLIKSVTGSAEIVKVLNKFGHCISYDQLEEVETAIASQVVTAAENAEVFIPSNIKSGIFSTFCWDNNDLSEETLNGIGTTHCTNGIILQKESDWCQNLPQVQFSKVERKRSLAINSIPQLDIFHGGKRVGPNEDIQLQNVSDFENLSKAAKLKDFCFILYRMAFENDIFSPVEQQQTVSAWTSFNTQTKIPVPRKNVIGYLQVIDSSPTELSTVNTALKRSIAIADKLYQHDVVIVFDQAIYAKALEIVWQKPQEYSRVVLRMGAFHTACSFLAVIGKRFGDAGLCDLLVESGVLGTGSLSGVIEGRHYNRAIRLHKLVFEGLQRMRWDAFGRWLQTNNCDFPNDFELAGVLSQIRAFRNTPSVENIEQLFQSEKVSEILFVYTKYSQNEEGPMKKFWNSYIDMVSLLLAFLRATREGNWELHLACIRELLPWYFAYDRQNYARYLPVYWLHMINLPKTHPEAHEYLSNGGFCVQRSSNKFSQSAVDQTIEQTLNRDTKTKGGIIGFSVNKSAVQRWLLNAHERAAISNACRDLAGMNDMHSTGHKETGKHRMARDESDVKSIVSTLQSWSNPFSIVIRYNGG